MSISVSWQRKDGVLIGTLDGRIDGSNAREFQSLLESGIEPGDSALILDFANVSFISSAALRVGLVIARRFNEQGRKFGLWPGKKFAICALSEPVRAVFSASGFEQLIAVYESQAEALKALALMPFTPPQIRGFPHSRSWLACPHVPPKLVGFISACFHLRKPYYDNSLKNECIF